MEGSAKESVPIFNSLKKPIQASKKMSAEMTSVHGSWVGLFLGQMRLKGQGEGGHEGGIQRLLSPLSLSSACQ